MRRKRYSEWFVRMKIAVRNRAIVCLCLLRFLFRGKSNVNVGTLKVILIVQLAKLGDMVCTTPMFRAVKIATFKVETLFVFFKTSSIFSFKRSNPTTY